MPQIALTAPETAVLRQLLGSAVERVDMDGFSVALHTPRGRHAIAPLEEVVEGHLCVVRPALLDCPTTLDARLLTNVGVVRSISIIRVAGAFGPLTTEPATRILGISIPCGMESSFCFFDPRDDHGDSVVRLDAGILFEFDSGRRLLAHSDGVSYCINAVVDDIASTLEATYKGKCLVELLDGR